MQGWIFGGEHQAQWMQRIYKKSFKFQNPLRQNYKHVKALEALLDVPADTIHSVVVFAGGRTIL
ncbi:nuclease-related domain-containing protein [Microbulbifer sp. TB1203]|uniref:nuclease-related domain-containing protein n=1 Tax=unclassified Microbulbifer TaxID=2619833 RepID=UPI0035B19FD4